MPMQMYQKDVCLLLIAIFSLVACAQDSLLKTRSESVNKKHCTIYLVNIHLEFGGKTLTTNTNQDSFEAE